MHLGFIIDGNRRWARRCGLSSRECYRTGYLKVIDMLDACASRGISHLSMFMLAKKNIEERSADELADIYSALDDDFLPALMVYLTQHPTQIHLAGNLALLPVRTRESFLKLQAESQLSPDNGSLKLMLALGYGGQDEIVRGIQSLCVKGADISSLDEEGFALHLDSGVFPPPDLIIRTGGQQRLSGFMLYATEYSEFFFSPKMWPEFEANDLDAALTHYQGVQRNFGR